MPVIVVEHDGSVLEFTAHRSPLIATIAGEATQIGLREELSLAERHDLDAEPEFPITRSLYKLREEGVRPARLLQKRTYSQATGFWLPLPPPSMAVKTFRRQPVVIWERSAPMPLSVTDRKDPFGKCATTIPLS